ncbi:MAG TPA: transcriptional regulator GcvA [Steroidobacteraceae bacterium]|nr:transcriptional regulator GcvA [Steroidobacteraceae bacterium]
MTQSFKLPLNALRAFEAVAAHLSFTDAAESLSVTTAAVSSHIKLLEEFLETPLFIRHSRSVRLTPQGARLLPGVQRGLTELTRAVEQLRHDRTSGLLNISLLGSFLQKWLLPRLSDFYRRYPDIDLRFNASRELVDFMQTDFHAAVRYGGGHWTDVKAERMLDDWVFPVTSPAMFAKLGPINTVADLNKYPLLHSASEPWGDWLRRLGGDTTRVERGPVMDDSASLLAAAEQGHGLALARWSLVAGDLAAGRLVRPTNQSVRQHNAYYFVAPSTNFDLPKVLRFRDWLHEVCGQFEPPEGEKLEPEAK